MKVVIQCTGMHVFGLLSLLLVLMVTGWWFLMVPPSPAPIVEPFPQSEVDPEVRAAIAAKSDLIVVDTPAVNGVVTSPLTISGKARGYWFFEGSFPLVLTDWDGRIISEYYATADGDWMTEDFVFFGASMSFENPYHTGDPEYMRHGTLILQRDNPSGLSENDDALEIPIVFAERNAAGSVQTDATYGQAIDAAKGAADLLSR